MFSHLRNTTMPAALFAAHIQHRQLCNIFPIPKPIPAAWQPCHICLRPLVFSFLALSHPQSLSPPSSLGAAGRPQPLRCAFRMAKGWVGLRFVSSLRDNCPGCSPPNAWMSSLRRLAWLGTGAVAPWRRHSSAESLFTYPLLRLFFGICSNFSSSCVLFFLQSSAWGASFVAGSVLCGLLQCWLAVLLDFYFISFNVGTIWQLWQLNI